MDKHKKEILSIRSDLNELPKVQEFLVRFCEDTHISEPCFKKILLCSSEGIVNAIQHGNQNNPKNKVSIFAELKNDTFSVSITDEGEGFDLAHIPDPTLESNILKERGRGIHIIKSMTDKFEYKRDEKCLKISFNCEK